MRKVQGRVRVNGCGRGALLLLSVADVSVAAGGEAGGAGGGGGAEGEAIGL